MSEMVERVARAMWKRWDTDVEDALSNDNPEGAMVMLARAAIAAVREPTGAMIDAANEKAVLEAGVCFPTEFWIHMIDEALR